MSGSNNKPCRRLRLLAAAFALASIAVGTASAGDVSFVRVWPGWRTTESFMHISEYFGGPEIPGGRIILRTHPMERTGCYFLARVRNKGGPEAGAEFLLRVITPGSPEAREFSFTAGVPSGEPVYEIGLTGADWPSRRIHPVAW